MVTRREPSPAPASPRVRGTKDKAHRPSARVVGAGDALGSGLGDATEEGHAHHSETTTTAPPDRIHRRSGAYGTSPIRQSDSSYAMTMAPDPGNFVTKSGPTNWAGV